MALAVFQDFLESQRTGIEFNLDESVLFKIVWFLFIPILLFLYKKLQNNRPNTSVHIIVVILSAIVVHLFLVPLVAVLFSVLFYQSRYDLYKFFTYTLAHDLYKLVIIYTSFVWGYKYFLSHTSATDVKESSSKQGSIVVNNGKENTIINVCDIVQITSATPYIFIHLEHRKYLHAETLKSICLQLDDRVFVRVHKSTVVNISKVSAFKSRLNGDYDLQLINGAWVRLSRTYADNFKKLFASGHRVRG
jgi:hypothetical protein